jgi:hypothetical protein
MKCIGIPETTRGKVISLPGRHLPSLYTTAECKKRNGEIERRGKRYGDRSLSCQSR